MKTLMFVGRKGGVGRSVLAHRLAEYWSKDRPVHLETDPESPTDAELAKALGLGKSDAPELTIVDTSRHDEARPGLGVADLVVVPLIPCAPDMRTTSAFLRELPPELLARTAFLPNMVSWSRYGEKPLNAHGEALTELDALSAELGMQPRLPCVSRSRLFEDVSPWFDTERGGKPMRRVRSEVARLATAVEQRLGA